MAVKHICYHRQKQHRCLEFHACGPIAVKSAALLREARLRAGLSQQQLAARSGKERTVIARSELGFGIAEL
jgi:ribosome-binding protein aMBF1 (putative translation factor)